MSTNTPMMIKVNSILGIISIMSFMSQDSEFFRKKVQFLPVHVSHSYQKGVSFLRMRHFFGCFSIKFLFFLWYFIKNGYAQFESFCAASVEWKSLHSVGEQPSFVLKIR